jgi:hypothetical protein
MPDRPSRRCGARSPLPPTGTATRHAGANAIVGGASRAERLRVAVAVAPSRRPRCLAQIEAAGRPIRAISTTAPLRQTEQRQRQPCHCRLGRRRAARFAAGRAREAWKPAAGAKRPDRRGAAHRGSASLRCSTRRSARPSLTVSTETFVMGVCVMVAGPWLDGPRGDR